MYIGCRRLDDRGVDVVSAMCHQDQKQTAARAVQTTLAANRA